MDIRAFVDEAHPFHDLAPGLGQAIDNLWINLDNAHEKPSDSPWLELFHMPYRSLQSAILCHRARG